MESVAPRLARWVDALTYEKLPLDVVELTKKCLLDQIGCQLVGATLPHVQPVFRHVAELAAKGDSTITLYGSRTAPIYAAYVNGTFGHAFEFDDSHALCGHPGVCVISSALAFGEHYRRSGQDLIEAIVAGYQSMALSGAAIHKSSRRLGWHGTKVQGVFGSAAAAAKLLRLDPGKITHALAIAGSEASGTMEYDQSGGEVKRLHAGSASRSGAQAALLAHLGLTGPSTIFEGKRGIFHLFGDGFDADPESFWATDFHIRRTMFKLTPAVFTIHGAIQAALQLHKDKQVDHRDVVRIEAEVAEITVPHGAGIVRPCDMIGAQFSLAFSVGLSLVRGHNRLADYVDSTAWRDPEILAIADRVTVRAVPLAPGVSEFCARLTVHLRDGRTMVQDQPVPRGHHDNPATFADILEKFDTLTAELIAEDQRRKIIDAVQNLEALDDCSRLTKLMVRVC
jgi:2-methylcitrate dehydratase PrpD